MTPFNVPSVNAFPHLRFNFYSPKSKTFNIMFPQDFSILQSDTVSAVPKVAKDHGTFTFSGQAVPVNVAYWGIISIPT
jgi:hypothetical protein